MCILLTSMCGACDSLSAQHEICTSCLRVYVAHVRHVCVRLACVRKRRSACEPCSCTFHFCAHVQSLGCKRLLTAQSYTFAVVTSPSQLVNLCRDAANVCLDAANVWYVHSPLLLHARNSLLVIESTAGFDHGY